MADLPLESIAWHVEVTGPLADLTVDQTFHNASDHAVDATYVFPLDADAAVDRMRIEVGGRVIEGEIHTRADADRMYAEAAAAGRLAALTEQERPDVFTQRVANIGPGETIRVTLSVIQPVPHHDGAYELTLPLLVAPRFVPYGTDTTSHPVPTEPLPTEPPFAEPGESVPVDIDVDVHAAVPLVRAESPTHTIDLAVDGDGLAASAFGVAPDRDFVLRWWEAGDAPQVGLLTHGDHALLTLEPPRDAPFETRVPRELIWVVDTSGSMDGAPLDLAVRAMRRAVQGMDADDSFTILRFSNGVSGLSRHPLPATPANRRRAERFLDHLTADGGTMMEPAVRAALDLPEDPDRHRVICLLTDGLVGNEDQVLTAVAAHPGVTFAAVGIGSSPNRYLLGELGRLGGGVTTYTTLDEDPEAALDRLVAAMDRPVLTDVILDWGDVPVDSVYPSRIPDLHVGTPLFVSVHSNGPLGPVRVTGRMGEGTFTAVVVPEPVEDGRPLETSWARAKVADLHRQKLAGELADEEPAITEVGLSAHILTDYTSFVAVERELPAEAPAAEPVAGDGGTLSKEFLARIPTGRSYQSAVSSVDGVVGTFSLNFNFDAIEQIAPSDDPSPRFVPLGGPLLAPPLPGLDAGNALDADLEVFGGGDGEGLTHAGVSAGVGGKIVMDRVWLASRVGGRLDRDRGLAVDEQLLQAHGVAQPNTGLRLEVRADGERAHVGGTGDAEYSRGAGSVEANLFFGPTVASRVWVAGLGQAVRGDLRHGGEVGALYQWMPYDDVLRELEIGATFDAQGSAGAPGADGTAADATATSTLGAGFVRSALQLGPVDLGGRLAFGAADGSATPGGPRPLLAPALTLDWDATGDDKTHLLLGAGRSWDSAGLQVGALDGDGLPGDASAASLRAEREVEFDWRVGAWGAVSEERRALYGRVGEVEVAQVADLPWYEVRGGSVGVDVDRTWASRWLAELHARYAFAPWTSADLLSDPRSAFVPGLLDPWRPFTVAGRAAWELPTDPWTFTVAVDGAWGSATRGSPASAAGSAEGWWLEDRTRFGLTLEQTVPLRTGRLYVSVGGVWAARDLDSAVLPVAVLATLPSAPSLEGQPPLQVWGELRWER